MNLEPTDPLTRVPFPLKGKSAVVTGVSRRAGIGYAIACRLAAYGANVFCHHFSPHDAEQEWAATTSPLYSKAFDHTPWAMHELLTSTPI